MNKTLKPPPILRGLFILQPKAPATITLTVSGDGVQTQTTPPFEVKKGESIIKNFVLQLMQTPDVVFPTSHVLLIKGGFQEKFARRQICPLYDLWRMKTEVIILKFVTLPENKVMKRCIKTGLGILLSILLLVLLSGPIYAQTDGKINYWTPFSMNFNGGLATGPEFVNNQDLGFWGFVDYNGIEKQIYDGYQWGISMAYRPAKYFDLFLNILLARYKLLMGKEGHQLKGPSIWYASGGTYSISPPLPHDIYYISKVSLGQIGVRLIYPIEKSLEPYIGLGLNVGSYQIAFGNKNGSRAYSEILNGEKIGRNLIFGVNFNILSQNKILLKISPYFEIGGLATEGAEMHDWIWQGWTYRVQFPIVPHYRFGIILGY